MTTIMTFLPSFFSIASLLLFNQQRSQYCYTIVLFSIISENVPSLVNLPGLTLCLATLVVMVLRDVTERSHKAKQIQKSKNTNGYPQS